MLSEWTLDDVNAMTAGEILAFIHGETESDTDESNLTDDAHPGAIIDIEDLGDHLPLSHQPILDHGIALPHAPTGPSVDGADTPYFDVPLSELPDFAPGETVHNMFNHCTDHVMMNYTVDEHPLGAVHFVDFYFPDNAYGLTELQPMITVFRGVLHNAHPSVYFQLTLANPVHTLQVDILSATHLNGSHGEATNEDDHPEKSLAQVNDKNMRKARHERRGTKHSKVKFGPIEDNSTTGTATSCDEVSQPPPLPPEPPDGLGWVLVDDFWRREIVTCMAEPTNLGFCKSGWCHRSYAEGSEIFAVCESGLCVPAFYPGERVIAECVLGFFYQRCHKDDPTVLIGQPFRLRPNFTQIPLPEVNRFYFPTPILTELKTKFVHGIREPSEVRIARTRMANICSSLTHEEMCDYITCYNHLLTPGWGGPALSDYLAKSAKRFSANITYADFVELVLSGQTFHLPGAFREAGVIFQGKVKYLDSRLSDDPRIIRWTIVDPLGVWDYKNDKFKHATKPGSYTPLQYFRFLGGAPTPHYSVHNNNLPSALSRMFKCRSDDYETESILENRQRGRCQDHIEALEATRVYYYARFVRQYSGVSAGASIVPYIIRRLTGTFRSSMVAGMLSDALLKLPDVANQYAKIKADWATDPDHFREWWVKLPHPKGAQRVHWEEAYRYATMRHETFNFQITAKIKREIAKYLKAPRLYVSYTEFGIFIPWVVDEVKKILDGVWRSDGERVDTPESGVTQSWFQWMYYVATDSSYDSYNYVCMCLYPSPQRLKEIFSTMLYVFNGSAGNTCYSVVFGDDGMTACHHNGRATYLLTDISSCDNSIGDGYFEIFHRFLEDVIGTERARQWSRQHSAPVRLDNPCEPGEYVLLKPTRRVMGSGTTITTLLGSLCNVDICTNLWDMAEQLVNPDTVDRAVALAGELCGFVVTCESTQVFEKLQFLKHSPYTVGGDVYHALNRGTMIRSLGCVDDIFAHNQFAPMPREQFRTLRDDARGELILADIYFGGVIRGYVNEPACPILDALRARFQRTEEVVVPQRYFNLGNNSYPAIPTAFYYERYGITSVELDEVATLIQGMRYGDFINHVVFAKLLRVDYGFVTDLDGVSMQV